MHSGYHPGLSLVIAHHDDGARTALIDAVTAAGDGITVVGIAAETMATHALVRRSAPDVALVEVDLPWGAEPGAAGGLDVASALRIELPTCAVILIGDDGEAEAAARAGASGWVDRAVAPAELGRAIRAVSRRELVEHASWVRAALAEGGAAVDGLPDLDRAILDALAGGDDVPEVGRSLHLTAHEVGRRAHDALRRLRSGSLV